MVLGLKGKRCFWILLLGLLAANLGAQSSLTGVIMDSLANEPVIGATVYVQETGSGAITDLEGRFSIEQVKKGPYTLKIQMMGYKTVLLTGVKPTAAPLSIRMAPEVEALDEVVVKAVRRLDGVVGINQEIKTSKMVVSGISARAIAQTQDKDAGEVVRRISGISVVDDKYIIARGLSQRYNNVWINNASVPSSEADSRAFSFDVIPSGQIENIFIVKSPVPELPADFSGGFIKINTKDTPAEQPFTVSYSLGANTLTHANDFLYSKGSATDWIGTDNGFRRLKGGMTGLFNNEDDAQVATMTRQGFNNDWQVHSRRLLPDQKLAVSYGKSFQLDNADRLSVVGALNYSYSGRSYLDMENSRFGVYNKTEDKAEYLYHYTDNQYTTSVKLGALLNVNYQHGNSHYAFRNTFNRLGQDKLTKRAGWQNISSLYNQEKTEYNYTSRDTYSGQLSGAHDLGRNKLDWELGYSYADKDQPDRRIINLQENDLVGDAYYGLMGIDQNDIERNFVKLKEHIASLGVNDVQTWKKLELKSGLYADYRTRRYRNRAFYYRFNPASFPAAFPYGDVVDEILQPENLGTDKLYLYDDTDNRDSYDGKNELLAAYVAVNLPLGRWNVYAGARYEHSALTLTSYTRISEWNSKDRRYIYDDLFPSANVSYNLTDKQLLRAAYGMSTNRPEFREVSSSVYYNFDLFSDMKGNPDLKAAYIQNLDLRYEWYPTPGESVSLALFYKHFRNPIETTFLDAGGSYTYTFENAHQASAYGVELDVRKNLAFMGMPSFDFTFNGSLIKSEVKFSEGSMEHNRPMQGQSPYLVNTGIYYRNEQGGLMAGVLYNRIGKRIVGIGKTDMSVGGSIDNDIPDMYEMPRNAVDLVLAKSLGKHWELKLNVKDLLAEKVVFCQFPRYTDAEDRLQERKQITKQFNPGQTVTLSLSAAF